MIEFDYTRNRMQNQRIKLKYDNNNMHLNVAGCKNVKLIDLAQDRSHW
jgi:hypothetical protein